MGYDRPNDAPVSSSWADHKYRNPPSAEPGTDYACAYGTDLEMADPGTVSVIDTNPGGGEGRRMSIDLDDGRRVSYIHLDSINAYVGQRVARGQRGLAISGASGFGSSWYYGPHVHTSLWDRPGMAYTDTIDFDAQVGGDTPVPQPDTEDEMFLISSPDTYPDGSLQRPPMLIAPGYAFWPPSQESVDVCGVISTPKVGNARQFDLWMAAIQQGTQYGIPTSTVGEPLSAVPDDPDERDEFWRKLIARFQS